MSTRTNLKIAPLIVSFILLTTAPTFAGNIIYVDDDATHPGDGKSWETAFTYLQDALATALSDDEIHVAQGVYKPDQGAGITPGNREATFQLINGIKIKGGYAGAGTPDPNTRYIELFETILTGDLKGNDREVSDPRNLLNDPCRAENSYHVVTGSGTKATAVLDGFTVTGGKADGLSYEDRHGGGMHNSSGSPTVTNCTFSKNSASSYGGGLAGGGALSNCTFAENLAGQRGGGLSGYRRLVGCTFIGNVAEYAGGMFGGGTLTNCTFIRNSASYSGGAIQSSAATMTTMTGCTFIENTANCGGAVWFPDEDESPTVINCTFKGNLATEIGGGIHLYGKWPTLVECTFSGNCAKRGGAVYYADGSYPRVTNCLFGGNSAEEEGGAMYSEYSGPMLMNCMVTDNSACWGGGIYNKGSSTTLVNCTFADNSGSDGSAIAFDSYLQKWPSNIGVTNCILWDSGNEIWNNDGSTITITYSDVHKGWPGEGNKDVDPCFVCPNSGDYHLLSDSPCIDAGDPSYQYDPNEADLDGRPRVICGRIDMGAYEFPGLGLLFVDDDATGKNDGRSWADAYNYLQDALAYANCAVKPVEIRVAQGVYTPDSNTSEPIGTGNREATFQLISGVILKGGYAGLGQPDPNARDIEIYETIITGDLAGNDIEVTDAADLLYEQTRKENSFHVVDGSGTEPTAILDGFLVVGGQAWSDEFQYINEYCFGGGLYIMSGSPTLRNCRFMANTALSYGGGVHMDGNSAPVIVNCGFSGNSATDGGGLNSDYGSPILTGCTFSGNAACSYNADGGFGGGMYNFYSDSKLTDCIFTENSSDEWGGAGGMRNNNSTAIANNCTFTNNSGGRVGGGGMLNNRGSLILTNCRFIGNSTRRNGGGMDSQETSELTLSNCIFIGNSAEDKGGGMCNSRSSPTLTNCTFSGNSADNCGGGMYNGGSSGPKITNCIFWGDAPEEINFDSGTIDVTYNDIQGGWPGQGNIDADPLFIEPGYKDANGVWIDGDYHLLPVSPCINTGDPNYIVGPNETDLDGRPRIIGGRIDMGAYEYSPPILAEVRISPRTINMASKGKWITCYIWLPDEYDVADIEPNSILLEDEIKPDEFSVEQQQVATARFSREEVHAILTVGEVELTITGQLNDRTSFEATDIIKVTDKAAK